VYSSFRASGFRASDSVSKASLFTSSFLIGDSNGYTNRTSIVELRVVINAAILSNCTIGFT